MNPQLDEREQVIIRTEKSRVGDAVTLIVFITSLLLYFIRPHDDIVVFISLLLALASLILWVAFSIRTQRQIDTGIGQVPGTKFPHRIVLITYFVVAVTSYLLSLWIALLLPFVFIGWFISFRLWKRSDIDPTTKVVLTVCLLLLTPLAFLWFIVFSLKNRPKMRASSVVGTTILAFLILFAGIIINIVLLRAFFYEPIVLSSDVLAPTYPQGSFVIFDKTRAARRSIAMGDAVLITLEGDRKVRAVQQVTGDTLKLEDGTVTKNQIVGILEKRLSSMTKQWR